MNILGLRVPDIDTLKTVQVWNDNRYNKYRIVIGNEEITGRLDPRKSISDAFAEVVNIIAIRAGWFGAKPHAAPRAQTDGDEGAVRRDAPPPLSEIQAKSRAQAAPKAVEA